MTGGPVCLPDEFVLCSSHDGCYGVFIRSCVVMGMELASYIPPSSCTSDISHRISQPYLCAHRCVNSQELVSVVLVIVYLNFEIGLGSVKDPDWLGWPVSTQLLDSVSSNTGITDGYPQSLCFICVLEIQIQVLILTYVGVTLLTEPSLLPPNFQGIICVI